MVSLETAPKPEYTPNSDELNEAIAALLKESVVPASNKKTFKALQSDNPNWKLTERRVQKYLKKQKKAIKAAAAADATTAVDEDDDDESVVSVASSVGESMRKARKTASNAGKKVKGMFSPGGKSASKRMSGLFRKKKSNEESEKEEEERGLPLEIGKPAEDEQNLLGDWGAGVEDEEEPEPFAPEEPTETDPSPEAPSTPEKVPLVIEQITIPDTAQPSDEVEPPKTDSPPPTSAREMQVYEDDNTGHVEKADLCGSGCVIL
mmetsp:Transcript_30089/g.46132  ORF Transcript_30089/g.46132 Transcript_30089/m.46132 type:complete len:263 (-) Transcript_30089:947-1735(-)|eukprot:CAMPEP_0195300444 /NCGR_PEP_ID=MMETSP0707-20130614/27432_1 /TAXON_ID=33640 /ORGANISM="Asterionellopsis glacialis, Strain CCMP134" /LENGTH=262 /DNA_ID=CAMNT_0040363129 /DNA_START=42 /DNA_END=830 /DNA_ORIENTATION=+